MAIILYLLFTFGRKTLRISKDSLFSRKYEILKSRREGNQNSVLKTKSFFNKKLYHNQHAEDYKYWFNNLALKLCLVGEKQCKGQKPRN